MPALKLHLGCGKRHIEGWYHVDANPHPHVNLVHAIDSLPMITTGSVDVIYTCHTLEHFTRVELPRVLDEWHRVLRLGGILRLAVPDLPKLLQVYKRSGELSSIIGPLIGGQRNGLYDFHYNVFDEPTLTRALHLTGFSNVHRWDWEKTEHSHVDDYSQAYWPHMDKETGIHISLNLECTKG